MARAQRAFGEWPKAKAVAGVPENPEVSAWHWLSQSGGPKRPYYWDSANRYWSTIFLTDAAAMQYHGPCLIEEDVLRATARQQRAVMDTVSNMTRTIRARQLRRELPQRSIDPVPMAYRMLPIAQEYAVGVLEVLTTELEFACTEGMNDAECSDRSRD